ncbi:MAG: alpha amylase catalytic region, partial [Actinomycetia bacterium]|nr:alpha amylase catalytic region [Actinomycetes bacterium]
MAERWYKEAVIYCLDVETYQDANADGIGDLPGLISRLDHIDRLGATCLWLNPIHPTPNRDDGYDITDYYGVDPRIGTLGDFAELLHQAGNRGLRVIIDLVVNHTSDQHPWFQAAR